MADQYVMGVKELEQNLEALDKKFAGKFLRKGMRAGAKVTQKAAKAAAPVAEGFTRAGLKIRSGKRKKNAVSILCAIARASIPGKFFYPASLMYGHRVRPHKNKDYESRATMQRVPANPWYKRAFDATAAAAHQAILRKLTEIFEPEVKAIAKLSGRK